MGVDLVGIIGHSFSKKEILDLPDQINKWQNINDYFTSYDKKPFKKAEWDGIINKGQLELIWRNFETTEIDKELFYKLENFDSVIDCCFGRLSIYRKTILITHWNHKYSNLKDPVMAKYILTINRMIAHHLNQNEIIYCTDSGYPTQSIQDKALSGLAYQELKQYGINTFGTPPIQLDEARKYMFFIDNLNEELGGLTLWDGDNPYWFYDSEIKDYKLKKHITKDKEH